MDLNDFEVEIAYPCAWTYTLIGPDRTRMEQVIADVVGDLTYTVTFAHRSRHGKYCSLHLEMTVETEEHRRSVFRALAGHSAFKAVL